MLQTLRRLSRLLSSQRRRRRDYALVRTIDSEVGALHELEEGVMAEGSRRVLVEMLSLQQDSSSLARCDCMPAAASRDACKAGAAGSSALMTQ